MAFHGYDDSSKNRAEEDEALAAYLADGGEVNKVPQGKVVNKIRRAKVTSQKRDNENGIETLFDFSEF